MIILIVEPQGKNLTVGEVSVEPANDGILPDRRTGIKTKAACVQSIARGRVIGVIA